jgi:hypothetical protein
MARIAVTDWLEAERDEFIDTYLRDHPEATEFEAAMMWTLDNTEPTKEQDHDRQNRAA